MLYVSTQLLETRQVFPSNRNPYESRTGGTGDGKDLLGQLAHPPGLLSLEIHVVGSRTPPLLLPHKLDA